MKNEYIVIDEEGSVLKYNLDVKELENMLDFGYNVLRVNNGKIEYSYISHPWKEINNKTEVIVKITWKEPELKESFY